MRHLAYSLVAAACGLLAAQARADNISFPGFAHGSESVTITMSSPNVSKTEDVSAGGFLTIDNGGPSFVSYCVDVYQTINFGAPPYPEYVPVGGAHSFANSNAYTDLSRLYAEAGVVADAVHEAAFQIAVWEIAYETTGTYSLSGGSASFSGGTAASSGALTLASTWLSGLGGTGPTISVLESRDHQDLIYAPVPEPETYALFMAGLAAVGFIAKRRKA
jgi:hypothetical protein